MAVFVDESLPLHPLTVDDIHELVERGILDPEKRVPPIDGVLVERSPQGRPHACATRRLAMRAVPIAAAAGCEVSVRSPLDVCSRYGLPAPDLVVAPAAGIESDAAEALLVVEMGATSLRMDHGRRARVYATAGVPDYWVLDVRRRQLVVHREPAGAAYQRVERLGEHETVAALELPLALPVADLL